MFRKCRRGGLVGDRWVLGRRRAAFFVADGCRDMADKVRYRKALGLEVCKRIAMGESLREICSRPEMPPREVVLGWLFDDRRAGFREAYGNARRAHAEMLMDELIAIIDTAADRDAMALAKVRMDVRRWVIDRSMRRDEGSSDGGSGGGRYGYEAALSALGLDSGPTDGAE